MLINDLKYEIKRLNAISTENSELIALLQLQNAEEIEKNKQYCAELNIAKEEIVLLEIKNNEIFENLQKELSIRAKEYKERTLNLLNTPSRSVCKIPEEGYYSPNKEYPRVSPFKEKNYTENAMPLIELIGKTPTREDLTKVQQERMQGAAIRSIQRPESPLKYLRVSSPSRRSPERLSPYQKQYLKQPY